MTDKRPYWGMRDDLLRNQLLQAPTVGVGFGIGIAIGIETEIDPDPDGDPDPDHFHACGCAVGRTSCGFEYDSAAYREIGGAGPPGPAARALGGAWRPSPRGRWLGYIFMPHREPRSGMRDYFEPADPSTAAGLHRNMRIATAARTGEAGHECSSDF